MPFHEAGNAKPWSNFTVVIGKDAVQKWNDINVQRRENGVTLVGERHLR